ncbi:MAG: glycosyltransferase [Myxococcota bacterium]|nr:glycosyltransferase [Myxococcota bacterium]
MKVLFFDNEQYVSYENEPSYYELRLPVLNCGVVTEHQDFVYQRMIREVGRDAMQKLALKAVADFKPDLIVYSSTWPDYLIDPKVLRNIMDGGTPIYAHIWDTWSSTLPCEMDIFLNANYVGIAESVSNYLFYRDLVPNQKYTKGVLFTPGHNVYTDIIRKQEMDYLYDVTILGSNEQRRAYLVYYLKSALTPRGIRLNKAGGLLDSTKRTPVKGLRLTDNWVSWEDYVKIINQSKICISSQTDPRRHQVKGKIFDYMACGTLCLTDGNTEVSKIVPDECLVYFDGFEDCLRKILYYLEHEDERRAVADKGQEWFMSTFDYKKYWSRVLNHIVKGEGQLPGLPPLGTHLEGESVNQGLHVALESKPKPDPTKEKIPWKRGRRTMCGLPWSKMELAPTSWGPCCHIRFGMNEFPTTIDDIKSLWNSTPIVRLRKRLVEGNLENTPCEKCYDRMFTTDHDILGMGPNLPRYSEHGPAFDAVYDEANKWYRQGRIVLPTLPIELYGFTSEACNLKCRMCHQNVNKSHLPAKVFCSLLSQMGWENLDRMGWVGGETLLTKDALEILGFTANANPLGTCVYITTNGTLLHRHVDSIDKIDNLLMTISIDGVRDVYEYIRRGAKWDRICENMMILKKMRANHPSWRININSIVMKSTYHCLIELIDLAEALDATLFFAPVNGEYPSDNCFDNPEILNDPNEFDTKMLEAIAYARQKKMFKTYDSLEKIVAFMDRCRIESNKSRLIIPMVS